MLANNKKKTVNRMMATPMPAETLPDSIMLTPFRPTNRSGRRGTLSGAPMPLGSDSVIEDTSTEVGEKEGWACQPHLSCQGFLHLGPVNYSHRVYAIYRGFTGWI
jgi:hypothetical protein